MPAATLPRHVLFLSGRSGVGLSWLVAQSATLLAQRGVTAQLLDTRRAAAPLRTGPGRSLVLVDAGPGINEAVLAFAQRVTLVVLVCTDDALLAADSYGVLKACAARGYRGPVVVISNKAREREIGAAVCGRLAETVGRFLKLDAQPLGAISMLTKNADGHYRNGDGHAPAARQPQVLRGHAGRCLRRLTERLALESALQRQGLWTQVAGLFV